MRNIFYIVLSNYVWLLQQNEIIKLTYRKEKNIYEKNKRKDIVYLLFACKTRETFGTT